MKVNLELPPPGNWIAFEDVCLKTWGIIWEIPHKIDFNSTNAQGQNGVDIVGISAGNTKPEGIQCKNKRLYFKSGQANKLSIAIIDEKVQKALTFEPPLAHLIIATRHFNENDIKIPVEVNNICIELKYYILL